MERPISKNQNIFFPFFLLSDETLTYLGGCLQPQKLLCDSLYFEPCIVPLEKF